MRRDWELSPLTSVFCISYIIISNTVLFAVSSSRFGALAVLAVPDYQSQRMIAVVENQSLTHIKVSLVAFLIDREHLG